MRPIGMTFLALSVSMSLGCQTLPPPVSRQSNVNGVSINFIEQGQGPTVVMVHGGISDHRIWNMQREAIATGHRYVAFDQRYFGTAPWPDDGSKFSFATHLDDLAEFIRELKIGPVDIVAWSYGSSLALELAVRNPELVKGMFLYEPAGAFTRAVLINPAYMKEMADGGKALGPAVAATRANDLAGATKLFAEWVNDQAPGSFDSITPPAIRPLLLDNARTIQLQMAAAPPSSPVTCAQIGEIKVPVTVAKGQQTRKTLGMLADAVNRCIPGSKLVTIPSSNHSAPFQNPTAFNDAVLAFLDRR
jgi:pimeloyl-ACP methyl ester carboxylesterase